jgi:hypothetical protein
MPDTLTSEIKASIAWLFQDSEPTGIVSDRSKLEFHTALADGASSNQADKVWHDERTVAASADDDLVLSALPLSLFDNALVIELAKVKAVLLVNLADTDGEDLVVGAAASDEWLGPFGRSGDSLTVPAGASLLLVNQKSGWPVAAGSADTLRISNAGHSDIDYKIAVLGTSA